MSVDLYVVRHADAGDADPSRWPDDGDRPLTEEGEKSFHSAARGLGALAESPDVVYCSPAVRAVRTAEILAEAAKWPKPLALAELEAGKDAVGIVRALAMKATTGSAAVVGHDPTLSELIGLLSGARVAMKKGGVALLNVKEFRERGAELRWLISPGFLARMNEGVS